MPLRKLDDGRTAAHTAKELFGRFRVASFRPGVHTLFSQILSGDTKR